jgi:hypothetical protein
MLDCPDHIAGTKLSCPDCGQSLQVPLPEPNKTVLGNLLPAEQLAPPQSKTAPAPASSMPPPISGKIEVRLFQGRQHVYWPCDFCKTELNMPLGSTGLSVECRGCKRFVQVPEVPASSRPVPAPLPPPPMSPPPPPPEPRQPRYASRREDDYDEEDDYDDEPAPPRRRRRYFSRSWEDRPFRANPYTLRQLTRAATGSLICSLLGLGLSFFAVLLFLIVVDSRPHWQNRPDQTGIMVLALMMLIVSFVLSLVGVIFGSRGMNHINTENRGVATAGLVCGIIGLIISSLLGLFCLFGLIAMHNRPYYL